MAPSMCTSIVEPSRGIILGWGLGAQPKLMTLPETVAPCPGVSIVPNGNTLVEFAQTIVLGAMTTLSPLAERATAWSVKVPLPPFGRSCLTP
jgi:hypothetical protein